MSSEAAGDLVLVDDSDTSVVTYTPDNAWETGGGSLYAPYHGDSYHVTTLAGARITFTFSGTYVAYYSDVNYDHDLFLASVDGGPSTNASSYSARWSDGPRLLFYTELSAGRHTLTITNVRDGASMGLDYFAYRPLEGVATIPAPTTSNKHPSASSSNAKHHPTGTFTVTPTPTPTDLAPHTSAVPRRSFASHHSRVSAPTAALIAVACCAAFGCVAALVVFLKLRDRRHGRLRDSESPPPYPGEARTTDATASESTTLAAPFSLNLNPRSALSNIRPVDFKRTSLTL